MTVEIYKIYLSNILLTLHDELNLLYKCINIIGRHLFRDDILPLGISSESVKFYELVLDFYEKNCSQH